MQETVNKGRNREFLWAGAAVAVGLLLSLVFFRFNSTCFHSDSFEYMRGGQSLMAGKGLLSMQGVSQVVFPPFYSILISLVGRIVPDPVQAGRAISLFASASSIFFIFLISRILWPGTPALAATWLFALLPLRMKWSNMVMTESTFLALSLAAALLWVAARSRPKLSLVCGAVVGAAYLTRPEGLLMLVFFAVGSLLLARPPAPRRFLKWQLLLLLLGFAIVASPYVLYLHTHTGKWQLTGKFNIARSTNPARAQGISLDRLRKLSADNRTIVHPAPLNDPRKTIFHIGRNVKAEINMLAEMVSPFLFIALGLGLAGAWWRGRGALVWPILGAMSTTTLVLPMQYADERYMLQGVVLMLLLAAASLRAQEGEGRTVSGRAGSLLPAALLIVALAWMLLSAPQLQNTSAQRLGKNDVMLAALRADKTPGAILGNGLRSRELALLTSRNLPYMPWEPPARVLSYARYQHAAFLLVRTTDHPDLAALAAHPVKTQDLTPLARITQRVGNNNVIMQLYRIEPPEKAKQPPP